MLVTERPEVCYYVKITVGRAGSEGVFAAVWRAGLPAGDPASLALGAPLLVLVIAFAFSCDRRIAENDQIGNPQDGGVATSQTDMIAQQTGRLRSPIVRINPLDTSSDECIIQSQLDKSA